MRMLFLMAACALVLAAVPPRPLAAQTDYYNTDKGRPVLIEDAYPVEFRGIELQVAPLRLERARGPVYRWGLEPEVAIGILPRTQVEIGLPLAYSDGAVGRESGLAGLDLSVLHNLNVETSLPAMAVSASVLLPVGSLAPDKAYPSLKAIATRTFRWARLHGNAAYTFGSEPVAGAVPVEVSRWLAGVAIDRTFPLRSLLLTAELHARQPVIAAEPVEWTAGGGTRFQLDPRWALDAGAGRHFTGDERAWYVTFGAAYAMGMPWRR